MLSPWMWSIFPYRIYDSLPQHPDCFLYIYTALKFLLWPFHLCLISSLLVILFNPREHIWYIQNESKQKLMIKVSTKPDFVIQLKDWKFSSFIWFVAMIIIVRQITHIISAWSPVQNKKEIKYLRFLYPIHVPTHGQWWSCTSIQTPH